MRNYSQSGYIALTSVIIISLLLITITAALSSANYFSRYNILENEYKEKSSKLAEACVNYAIQKISGNLAYSPTTPDHTVIIGSDVCDVVSVFSNAPVSGQTTITTQGIYPQNPPDKSYTNLKVVINSNNLSLISWEEIPN